MGILTRFTDIISSNVNALLDKAEDPSKLVDQYLRKANSELTEVKKEAAGVMAEESRTKRLVIENEKEVAKSLSKISIPAPFRLIFRHAPEKKSLTHYSARGFFHGT